MRIYRQKSNNTIKFQVRKVDIDEKIALNTLIDFANDAHTSEWYFEANKWANEVANRLGYTLEQVVGVTALLSPMTEWGLNKKRAERVLESWQRGEKISVTFAKTMENVYKCLNGEEFTFGPKTGVFYQNILTPSESVPATVDSLAISIILGMGAIPGTYSVKPNTLELIQNIYVKAAAHYNVPISSIQAATWVKANQLRKNNRGFGATLHSRFEQALPVHLITKTFVNDDTGELESYVTEEQYGDLTVSEVLALIA